MKNRSIPAGTWRWVALYHLRTSSCPNIKDAKDGRHLQIQGLAPAIDPHSPRRWSNWLLDRGEDVDPIAAFSNKLCEASHKPRTCMTHPTLSNTVAVGTALQKKNGHSVAF